MSYLELGCRALLAGAFLVALFGKLRGAAAYRGYLASTRALLAVGARPARVLGTAAVGVELAAVALLAVPRATVAGYLVAAGLLCCFTAALARALRRGQRTSCHCFGASDAPIGVHHVVRNAVLVAAAGCGLLVRLAAGTGGYRLAGVAVTGLAVVVCVLIVARLDDLVGLFRGR